MIENSHWTDGLFDWMGGRDWGEWMGWMGWILVRGDNMSLNIADIYDNIETKFFKTGLGSLSADEVVIFAVAIFFGQMRDGGLVSIFSDPWIKLVPHVPSALRSIGADEYAEIADQMLSRGIKVLESDHHDELEALEDPFWVKFHMLRGGNIIDDQLCRYASEHQMGQER